MAGGVDVVFLHRSGECVGLFIRRAENLPQNLDNVHAVKSFRYAFYTVASCDWRAFYVIPGRV
jgi:hypothetical protein